MLSAKPTGLCPLPSSQIHHLSTTFTTPQTLAQNITITMAIQSAIQKEATIAYVLYLIVHKKQQKEKKKSEELRPGERIKKKRSCCAPPCPTRTHRFKAQSRRRESKPLTSAVSQLQPHLPAHAVSSTEEPSPEATASPALLLPSLRRHRRLKPKLPRRFASCPCCIPLPRN
ncbi:hypothetical protein M0R45_001303 [Rubus argutus]|uniref:Uncharacterized protein n=1 Tax=Rubus argutus TaxID=59490 RepID=A0AAW1VJC9_RUBAR